MHHLVVYYNFLLVDSRNSNRASLTASSSLLVSLSEKLGHISIAEFVFKQPLFLFSIQMFLIFSIITFLLLECSGQCRRKCSTVSRSSEQSQFGDSAIPILFMLSFRFVLQTSILAYEMSVSLNLDHLIFVFTDGITSLVLKPAWVLSQDFCQFWNDCSLMIFEIAL